MADDIYQIYNKAIKEQQAINKPLSVIDEILAYRNQLASIKQQEEEKRLQQMGLGKRVLHTVGDTLGTIGKGVSKGLEGMLDAGASIGANLSNDQDMKDNLTRNIAYDRTGQSGTVKGIDEYTKGSYLNDTWLEGAIQSVGEMLPSIALNAIPGAGQVLSTASFVASASGRGTEQALNEGATLEQATKYGITSGAVEGAIEMASGGIGGIGSGWLAKVFPKVAGKVSTKLMTKPIVKIGLSMLGEGFEEVASELIDPQLQRIYKNKEDIEPATMESIAQSFFIGAMASGILQGASVKLQGKSNYKASLITEQIESINEKITQETENGTMTQEKAEVYQEQQEELLQQLETTLGASVVVKDTAQQQTTPTEVKQEETKPTINPKEDEKVIIQENEIRLLTEGLEETKPTETKEREVVDLGNDVELVEMEDGSYNLRIKNTEIYLQKKNNTKKYIQGLYNQLKKNDTLGLTVEAMKNKNDTTKPTTDEKVLKSLPKKETQQPKAQLIQTTTQTEQVEQETPKQTEQTTPKEETKKENKNDTLNVSLNVAHGANQTTSQQQTQQTQQDTKDKILLETPKNTKTWHDRKKGFQRMFTNSMANVESFLKNKGVKNGEAITNKARTARSVGGNMVSNGIIEVEIDKGKITKITKKSDGLVQILSFLNNKSEEYKKSFSDYLLHKHNQSRMNLPFEVNATTEQISTLKQALQSGEISKQLYDTLTTKGQTTDILTVRQQILAHTQNMSDTTLNTILNLMGDQKPVFGIDTTADMSKVKVEEYERSHPEFAKHAEKIYNYNRALLQEQVKAGLITQASADYFNQTYPHYVPTHRYQKGMSSSAIKKGDIQSGINTATGSDLVILPIDEQLFKQTMRVSQAMTLNPLLQELERNAEKGSEVEIAEKVRITDINQIDMKDEGNKNRFSYLQESKDANGETFIERVTLNVSNGIAEGIKSVMPTQISESWQGVTNTIRAGNTMFKKITTSLNPFFSWWRNPIRDVQNALLFTKYGIKTFAKNIGKAVREIKNNGNLWQTYQANGGSYSSIYNFNEGNMKSNYKGLGKLFTKLEQFSSFIEQVPRLSEFISSIEAGNTIEQAILDSADVTVNFGRSGVVTKTLNGTVMPFFNAKMQGALKVYRSFIDAGFRKQAVYLAMRMAVLGISFDILNNFLYDDDEEYQNMRLEDKSQNMLIKIGNTWIKLPKAQITGAISSVYNRSIEKNKGDENAFKGAIKDIEGGFSPVESLRTIFSPFSDIKSNTTWYGGQIESSKFNNVRPRDRYDESTSEIAKFIGRAINYSPKKIHYLMDQYSGVIGDFILPATSSKYSLNPIEKTFTVDPTTSSKYSSRFYSLLEEAQYDKSDGDMVAYGKVRYLNKIKDSLSDLYQAQRDINNDSKLSNDEKRSQVETIQIMINNIQKSSVEGLKTFSDTLSKFPLTTDSFDDDYREATRLTFGAETALRNYNKNTYEKAQTLYNDYDIDYDIFYCVYFDSKDLEGDFDFTGEYIRGTKQVQIWNYINKLNISKKQKEALYEAMGYKINTSSTTDNKNPFKAYGE